VTALDSEQARAAAAPTRAALPVLQTSIGQTRRALASRTGQSPGAMTAQLAAAGPLPQAGEPLAMAIAIPTETLRQRADARAAEFEVAAALVRVDPAEAQRWPKFSIGGSLGVNALTRRADPRRLGVRRLGPA
jgi:multidrug efflux system outer membrane protein